VTGRSTRLKVLALAGVAALLTACTSSAAETSDHSAGHDHSTMVPSELNDQAKVGNFDGAGLVPPKARPSFVLKDTDGQTVDFGTSTAGRPTMLFFGYTHCPDECPTTFADINLALRQVPAAVRSQTLVVFVTTDVKRDTGPVIRKWLDQFAVGLDPKQFIGLYGTQAEIDAAQGASGIPIATDDGETHAASVQLYGPDDYAHVQFLLGDTEQKAMVHDLPIVAAMK
jgi:protein SCO1/2